MKAIAPHRLGQLYPHLLALRGPTQATHWTAFFFMSSGCGIPRDIFVTETIFFRPGSPGEGENTAFGVSVSLVMGCDCLFDQDSGVPWPCHVSRAFLRDSECALPELSEPEPPVLF